MRQTIAMATLGLALNGVQGHNFEMKDILSGKMKQQIKLEKTMKLLQDEYEPLCPEYEDLNAVFECYGDIQIQTTCDATYNVVGHMLHCVSSICDATCPADEGALQQGSAALTGFIGDGLGCLAPDACELLEQDDTPVTLAPTPSVVVEYDEYTINGGCTAEYEEVNTCIIPFNTIPFESCEQYKPVVGDVLGCLVGACDSECSDELFVNLFNQFEQIFECDFGHNTCELLGEAATSSPTTDSVNEYDGYTKAPVASDENGSDGGSSIIDFGGDLWLILIFILSGLVVILGVVVVVLVCKMNQRNVVMYNAPHNHELKANELL